MKYNNVDAVNFEYGCFTVSAENERGRNIATRYFDHKIKPSTGTKLFYSSSCPNSIISPGFKTITLSNNAKTVKWELRIHESDINSIKKASTEFVQNYEPFYLAKEQVLCFAPRTLAFARKFRGLLDESSMIFALFMLAHIGAVKDVRLMVAQYMGHLMILNFDKYLLMAK